MIEDRPSLTAEHVAMRRAAHQLLDVPPLCDDPVAVRTVDAEPRAEPRREPARPGARIATTRLRAFLAVRTLLAEESLALAVAAGVTQYVVLGAGLDTFAHRNPHPGLKVFEVDHPATQAWRRERLDKAEIAVPAGVAFDYLVSAVGQSGRPRAVIEALAARLAAICEPIVGTFEPQALEAALRGLGFDPIVDLGPDELNARHFAGCVDGLRVGSAGRVVTAWVGRRRG